MTTPRPPYRPPLRPRSGYAPPAKKGGGSFGKFLLLLILLAAGAFGYATYHFNESPQQVCEWLIGYIGSFTKRAPNLSPPPTSTTAVIPTPASTPAVIPTPTPTLTSEPPATPTATPIDPLSWIVAHKDYWPKEVILLEPTEFPLIYNGEIAGSAKVPAGSIVKVVAIESEFLTASYTGGTQRIAVTATDLRLRAEVAMKRAVVDSAAAATAKAAVIAAATATPATFVESPGEPAEVEDLVVGSGTGAFVHPGLLHGEEDFKRMRTQKGREPWRSGWEKLIANGHASLGYIPRPVENVVRGRDRLATAPENYSLLFNDIAAAYACALRWRISGDHRYAEKSIEILNAWSATLKTLSGSTDVCLAAGIYGYEFANAAEIMRTYKGWKPEDMARFQKMMTDVFLPINERFLDKHNGTPLDHYWANWDLCNMASLMAIGVLCDKRSLYNEAVGYFKHGKGNGAVRQAVYYIHPDGLGQWQESGRDQGHTTMGIGIMGAICEMAWKQGDDLYGYDNNRFLAGCEYVAKYNLGEDVPFKPYTNDKGTQTVISSTARGNLRPVWELVYNHYVRRKGLSAPYTTRMAETSRPEGGGGDYGANSGGFDQLGYGTLTATLDKITEQNDTSWPCGTPPNAQ